MKATSVYLLLLIVWFNLKAHGRIPTENTSQTQSTIAQSNAKLENQEEQARKIVKALFDIQVRTRTLVRRKTSLTQEKAGLEETSEIIKTTIQEKEAQIARQRIYLGRRIQALVNLKGQSFFQALFAAQSPNQIGHNLKILGVIATRDQRVFKELLDAIKLVRQEQKRLGLRLAKIKKLEKTLAQQETSLLDEQARRRIILKNLHHEKLLTLSKIEMLRKAIQSEMVDDSGLLDPLLRPSFLDQKGALSWPVSNFQMTPFGRDTLVKGGPGLFNKGVFLRVSKGTPVKAVFDGRVAFLGQIEGLGTTVVIEHGDHFYTVYSHVDQVFVEPEGKVQTRQKIALAGNDQVANLPGIYFEVRHFSEPSDPNLWMKGTL